MIDQIIRNMSNIPKSSKDIKELKFLNGILLINSLAKLEHQKLKSSLQAAKARKILKESISGNNTDDILGKRKHPNNAETIYYLKKKPKPITVESMMANLQNEENNVQMINDISTILKYDETDPETNQNRANLAIKLNTLLSQMQMKNLDMFDDNIKPNDEALLDFLGKDDELLLDVANKWLYELFEYSVRVNSAQKYYTILEKILIALKKESLINDIFSPGRIKLVDLPTWEKFIKNIPLLSPEVFDYLLFVILSLKDAEHQKYTINIFKELLLKSSWHPELSEEGMNKFLEIGLVESVKLVVDVFYKHPTFQRIVDEFKDSVFEKLKNENNEKKLEGYARSIFAFTRQGLNLLLNIFQEFPQFNPKIHEFIGNTFELRINVQLRSFNPDDQNLRTAIHYMFDNPTGRELLLNKLTKCVESNALILQDEDIQAKKRQYLIDKKINEKIQSLIQKHEEMLKSPNDDDSYQSMLQLLTETKRSGYDIGKIFIRLHFQPLLEPVIKLLTTLIESNFYTFDDLVNMLKVISDKNELSPYIARSVLLTWQKLNKTYKMSQTDPNLPKLTVDRAHVADVLTGNIVHC